MRVALFATCLVDLFRPQAGFAAARLLEAAGCEVVVPIEQTCCGQPAWNAGDARRARAVARHTIAVLEPYARVVVPSGSCAGMIRHHYPALFADDPAWRRRAEAVAARTHELTAFLAAQGPGRLPPAPLAGPVAYHDSCSSLRELGVREEPRRLLAEVCGCEVREPEDAEGCCGFGGAFAVKFPEISARIGADKVARLAATGARVVLAGDLGCLLHQAGRARRLGLPLRFFHVAEALAGMTDGPAIGEPAP
ncbi:(Fe-S)-binding protein [Inmirania thermothiophila]|uniref:L-lactate dehydrogenase complex protein LldE n=1 Tax=Inmirania thermothiophila TaxID=1750597 RepID=A0A3N1Y656_9GAMM|nr:(Fe-S)-binding protein [Inmirania thermothiophila]ROR34296.1 L-lactate dehydrogenase complex protein LldE [Inmirania thermothiophila]